MATRHSTSLDEQTSFSDWLPNQEGQLSVDVIENHHDIIIRSAIAGVQADDLDISVTSDTVTIRGSRDHFCEETAYDVAHVTECHWGSFSRSIVLPCQVRTDKTDAVLKQGILTITLPKVEIDSHVEIFEIL